MYSGQGDTSLHDSDDLEGLKFQLANAEAFSRVEKKTCRSYRCCCVIVAKGTVESKSKIQPDNENKECPSQTAHSGKNNVGFMIARRNSKMRSATS